MFRYEGLLDDYQFEFFGTISGGGAGWPQVSYGIFCGTISPSSVHAAQEGFVEIVDEILAQLIGMGVTE